MGQDFWGGLRHSMLMMLGNLLINEGMSVWIQILMRKIVWMQMGISICKNQLVERCRWPRRCFSMSWWRLREERWVLRWLRSIKCHHSFNEIRYTLGMLCNQRQCVLERGQAYSIQKWTTLDTRSNSCYPIIERRIQWKRTESRDSKSNKERKIKKKETDDSWEGLSLRLQDQ